MHTPITPRLGGEPVLWLKLHTLNIPIVSLTSRTAPPNQVHTYTAPIRGILTQSGGSVVREPVVEKATNPNPYEPVLLSKPEKN